MTGLTDADLIDQSSTISKSRMRPALGLWSSAVV